MFIKHVAVKTFCGITERTVDLGKVNYISGRKGCGKTSLVEAIQKGFTNKSERVEVIRHGEEEATIFIQTDTGLEIDRKIRTNKTDYLKVRKPGEAVPTSEKYLKQFINGDVFRPLEFISRNSSEQAKIILNMLEIPWTLDDITNWFGEMPDGINYEAHILQVLGQVVAYYFAQRESINREIAVLRAQVAGYRNELPPNYDGNEWREKKVAEYYAKVHDAEQINKSIDTAKNLVEGLEGRIATVRAESETEKQVKKNELNEKRSTLREFKQFLEQKIEKTNSDIKQSNTERERDINSLDSELERKLLEVRKEYAIKQDNVRVNSQNVIEKLKQQISDHKTSITNKDFELSGMDQIEENTMLFIDEKTAERIKTEDAKSYNARKTLMETTTVEVEPLTLAADKVASMQSYLRDFDLMASMIREKLAPKEELSKTLTARIEKGREMPKELLKIAALPIPGITVDSDGDIRQDETLIDGLSEGEQLELAFRVAKAQAGDLKLICLDGWNKINSSDREWIEKEIAEDEFQYIILSTVDGDLEVKIEGETK